MSEARCGEALLEHARALVDQRVDAALDDLLDRENVRCGMPASRAVERISVDDLGIRDRLALLVVEIPALAGLLTDAAHLVQLVGDERPALARLAEVLQAPAARARRRRGRPCRPRRRSPSPCRSRSAPDPPARASPLPRRGTAPRTCTGTSSGCRRSPGSCRRRPATLPSRFAKATTRASTSGLVFAPRTISTSRMTFAGLKKCRPTTLDGRAVTAAIASMSSVEVLVARTAPGLATRVDTRERPASSAPCSRTRPR